MADDPTYADLVEEQETLLREEMQRRARYDSMMYRLNKRIQAAMEREVI